MNDKKEPFGRKIELHLESQDGLSAAFHYLRAEDGTLDTFVWTINEEDHVLFQNECQKMNEHPEDEARAVLHALMKENIIKVHFDLVDLHWIIDGISSQKYAEQFAVSNIKKNFRFELPKKSDVDFYIRQQYLLHRDNLSQAEKTNLLYQMEQIQMLPKRIKLKGTRYDGRSERIENVHIDDEVQLVREPENPHDANAINVRNHEGSLGYVPKEFAAFLAPLMDAGDLVLGAAVTAVTPLSECAVGQNDAEVEIGLSATVAATGKTYKLLNAAFRQVIFPDDKEIKKMVSAVWTHANEMKEKHDQIIETVTTAVADQASVMNDLEKNILSITDFSSKGIPHFTSRDSLFSRLFLVRFSENFAEIENLPEKTKETVLPICAKEFFWWSEASLEQLVDYFLNVPASICTLNIQYKRIDDFWVDVKFSYDKDKVVLD